MTSMPEILETLAQGQDLTAAQSAAAFGRLMNGELSEGQAGALLLGLRAKGEKPHELAAAVGECLKHARTIPGLGGARIDTCGTGGDCQGAFNCSTAVALLLAAMGHTVVKHGNRSVSSRSGSADVLEAMGLPLETPPDSVAGLLDQSNFVFLFAPAFHPAFRHVMPLRKALGIRTLFNLMGPLLNPARPTHQLLGVPETRLVDLVARTLALTGVDRAAVVHGQGAEGNGYDELTPFGLNQVAYVSGGVVELTTLDPSGLGLADDREGAVKVCGPHESQAAVECILAGQGNPVMTKMVVLNLAMALHLLEGISLPEAVSKARTFVASGHAASHFGLGQGPEVRL